MTPPGAAPGRGAACGVGTREVIRGPSRVVAARAGKRRDAIPRRAGAGGGCDPPRGPRASVARAGRSTGHLPRQGRSPAPCAGPTRSPGTTTGRRRAVRTSRTVSRILCPVRLPVPGGGHPSRDAVADVLQRSTRQLGRAALDRCLSDLAPGGVYRAAPVARSAGGLLHHRFTLTRPPHGDRAVCSLWHCPAGRPGWALPTTLPCGVRTFLGGHIAAPDAAARPARPTPTLARPNAGQDRDSRRRHATL